MLEHHALCFSLICWQQILPKVMISFAKGQHDDHSMVFNLRLYVAWLSWMRRLRIVSYTSAVHVAPAYRSVDGVSSPLSNTSIFHGFFKRILEYNGCFH